MSSPGAFLLVSRLAVPTPLPSSPPDACPSAATCRSTSPTPTYCMVGFAQWLVLQERTLVDPAVIDSYDHAFQQGLEGLIQRTRDPELRQAFEAMRQFRFAAYIIGSLVKNGIHQQYDLEDCLQRICFRMLSPVGERGLPKGTLFDLDQSRPYDLTGNPLEARFKTFLSHELRDIKTGRIPALRKTQRPGSLSIAYGGQGQGTVSPDEIPGRQATYDREMLDDIMELLRRRSTPDLDLVALFVSILAGEGTRAQRSRFGHDRADAGRKTIVQVIEQYAQRTQSWGLLGLLDRFRDFQGNRPDPARRPATPPKAPKPKYPPDEQDYRSIVDVLERNGRRANMAVLGKLRRRWLERPPRDPSSPHPNRLVDVLSRMVADGVLAKLGAKYIPGRNYGKYLPTREPVAVR